MSCLVLLRRCFLNNSTSEGFHNIKVYSRGFVTRNGRFPAIDKLLIRQENESISYSWKEHHKFSKIAKFGRKNVVKCGRYSSCEVSRILYTFVLRAESVAPHFERNVVQTFLRVIQKYTKFAKFHRTVFSTFYDIFATKLHNLTNFMMLFLAVLMEFSSNSKVCL